MPIFNSNICGRCCHIFQAASTLSYHIQFQCKYGDNIKSSNKAINDPDLQMQMLRSQNIEEIFPGKIENEISYLQYDNRQASIAEGHLELSRPQKKRKFQSSIVEQIPFNYMPFKYEEFSMKHPYATLNRGLQNTQDIKIEEPNEKQSDVIIQTQLIIDYGFEEEEKKPTNHIKNADNGKQYKLYVQLNTRLIRKIHVFTNQIKQFSKIFSQLWQQTSQFTFKYNLNYRHMFPTFIFAINPFKQNNIKDLRQQNANCHTKHKTYSQIINNFCDHFMGYCCPINTKSSTYLILWSDCFYSMLLKNTPQYDIFKYNKQDYGYYQYLYEKTDLSKEIDRQYPNFKHYLGYLHAYIFSHNIIDVCKICKFQCPGAFMQLRGIQHFKDCPFNNKQIKGIKIEIRKNKDNLRHLSANILNITKIEDYNFFCPSCDSINNKMSPQMLLEHIEKHHAFKSIKICLNMMFK